MYTGAQKVEFTCKQDNKAVLLGKNIFQVFASKRRSSKPRKKQKASSQEAMVNVYIVTSKCTKTYTKNERCETKSNHEYCEQAPKNKRDASVSFA